MFDFQCYNFKKLMTLSLLLISFFAVGLVEVQAGDASGVDDGVLSDVMCRVVTLLTGKVGKAIATIAVVVLGVGLFLGKLSWGIAVATAIGIALIFGAEKFVNWLAPESKQAQCNTTSNP